ncbi:EamA family transporter [Alkalibaculum sp. M08DMB]|uniref:EamA family transporter n=1 Tax=Alkalibaculum sporogenes TaxID=2655001 RepID=A0A6A7K8V2_9FIRM|nr:DMT family transporter [Alkalibaculum sporogenes]MPW25533.1 EamA family transporter [Alkalibaculum sporogenes]
MRDIVKSSVDIKNIKYVKMGIVWAVLAGLMYGVGPTFQTYALMQEPYLTTASLSLMLVPMSMAAAQDLTAAFMVFLKNMKAGKHKEYLRVIRTKPGKFVIIASIFGGPVALGTYMAAVILCGPVYAITITAILPVVGALLSRIFLKEKISSRGWFGIAMCIAGSALISWMAPSAEVYPHFYLGVALAFVTALGWASEAVISTAGMDFIDPEIAIGTRFVISGTFSLIALPIVSGIGLKSFGYFVDSIFSMSYVWMIGAAFFAGFSYFFYYKACNAAGAARSMAINPSYTLVATLLGVVIFKSTLSWNFFVGLAFMLIGTINVVGKPSDLLSLRNLEDVE